MPVLLPESWRVYWLVYYGRPVVMASYDFPDTRSAAMRRGMNSLAEYFGEFNLKPVDRYLRSVPVATSSCSVELVESGLTVQFSEKGVFPGCSVPEATWVSLAEGSGSCIVAITVGDVSIGNVQEHLRRQAGNGTCWGAEARYIDNRTIGFDTASSRYKFLGLDGPKDLPRPVSCAVCLDSNVVLDLEKAAQGRVSDALHKDLQGLVRNLRYQDCRPALAISELCWSGMDGRYRLDREASLFAAVDAWFDDRAVGSLSPDSLRARWESRVHYHNNHQSELQNLDIRRSVTKIYCCLLKLSSLLVHIDGFRANQRLEYLVEYCRWANEDLGFVLAYPLKVAFDALVGSGRDVQYTRKLLKFGKNVLRNIWGASWDLAILMQATDVIAAGKGYNPLNLSAAGLITADKALVEIRSRLIYQGMMQHSHRSDDWRVLVATQFVPDPRLADQSSAIHRTMSDLYNSVMQRLESAQRDAHSFELLTEVDRLERLVLAGMAERSRPCQAANFEASAPERPRWWQRIGDWAR